MPFIETILLKGDGWKWLVPIGLIVYINPFHILSSDKNIDTTSPKRNKDVPELCIPDDKRPKNSTTQYIDLWCRTYSQTTISAEYKQLTQLLKTYINNDGERIKPLQPSDFYILQKKYLSKLKKPDIVFLGDSRISSNTNLNLTNFGVSGTTFADAVKEAQIIGDDWSNVETVHIAFGINDLKKGRSVESIIADAQKLLVIIRGYNPNCTFYLYPTIPPRYLQPSDGENDDQRKLIEMVNQNIPPEKEKIKLLNTKLFETANQFGIKFETAIFNYFMEKQLAATLFAPNDPVHFSDSAQKYSALLIP